MREHQRKIWRRIAVAALFIAGLSQTGCESADPHESNIPWARPATWEGGAPGMGTGGFNQGRTGY